MSLGLGLASSHAPSMFAAPEDWPRIYETLTKGVPQPPQAAAETPEVIATYVQRIRKKIGTTSDGACVTLGSGRGRGSGSFRPGY